MSDSTVSDSGSTSSPPMAVSTGSVDITPHVGHPMAGWAVDTPRLSTGVNEPLHARCTIFWDHGVPKVIVTADVLAFGATMHAGIRAGVIALGVATADFVLTATHTHNGPVLTEKLSPFIAYDIGDADAAIASYAASVVAAVVRLVAVTLVAPKSTCTLHYGVATADSSYNREGLAYVEHDVPILVAVGDDGTPRAVMFGFGTHPVAANLQTMFDPDYPSEAIKVVEASWPGVFAQFLTGPAGDQNPTNVAGGFSGADAMGSALGEAVVAAIGDGPREITGAIDTAITYVALPLDILDTPANMQAVRAAFIDRAKCPTGFYRRHAQEMIAQIDAHSFPTSVVLPIQRWRFAGDPGLQILFSGGELVSGYAVHVRTNHGGSEQVWVTGYANEIPSYIPSDELLRHGSYAGGWDDDYPGIAGGSMTVYGYLAHYRGMPSADSEPGVEQILIGAFEELLSP